MSTHWCMQTTERYRRRKHVVSRHNVVRTYFRADYEVNSKQTLLRANDKLIKGGTKEIGRQEKLYTS